MKKRTFGNGGEVDGAYIERGSGPMGGDAGPAPAPKKTSFGEAFASARRSGAKAFEWNGKKYTTEVASAKPKTSARPAAERTTAAPGWRGEAGSPVKSHRPLSMEGVNPKTMLPKQGFKKGGSVKPSAMPAMKGMKSMSPMGKVSRMGAMKPAAAMKKLMPSMKAGGPVKGKKGC